MNCPNFNPAIIKSNLFKVLGGLKGHLFKKQTCVTMKIIKDNNLVNHMADLKNILEKIQKIEYDKRG